MRDSKNHDVPLEIVDRLIEAGMRAASAGKYPALGICDDQKSWDQEKAC